MPKPTPLYVLAAVAFLAFYGFAVFALTRDYYLRHPPRVAAAPAVPQPAAQARPRPPALTLDNDTRIPASIAETNPVLLMQGADEAFGQRRYAAAIPLYRRVLELAPENLDAYTDLGLSLHYAGQTSEAVAVLAQGAAKGPASQRLWLSYGFVLGQSGDPAGAAQALTRARELGPDNDMGREADRMLGALAGTAVPAKP